MDHPNLRIAYFGAWTRLWEWGRLGWEWDPQLYHRIFLPHIFHHFCIPILKLIESWSNINYSFIISINNNSKVRIFWITIFLNLYDNIFRNVQVVRNLNIVFYQIGSLKSPDGRFSPTQSSLLQGQGHPLSMHPSSSHLHQSSSSGENVNTSRPGFSIQNNFMPPSSIPGNVPSIRPLGLLAEEGRSGRLSPNSDISSKTLLERSLKNMNNSSVSLNSKLDSKGKYMKQYEWGLCNLFFIFRHSQKKFKWLQLIFI